MMLLVRPALQGGQNFLASCTMMFLWKQNLENNYWDENKVDEELNNKMRANTAAVLQTAKEHNVRPRIGAYILAVKRISGDAENEFEQKYCAEDFPQQLKTVIR